MAFQWSSPVRKNERGVLLSPIPNEIFTEVFSYVQPEEHDFRRIEYHRTLSRLALVCRYFCSLMVPRLLETMFFDGTSQSGREAQKNSAFCRTLAKDQGEGRALAKHIQSCHFMDWMPGNTPTWAYAGFLKLYFSAMVYMENLVELHLQAFVIKAEHFRALPQLKRLSSLHLIHFSIEEYRSQDYQKFRTMKLKTLKILGADKDYTGLTEALDYSQLTTLLTCLPSSVAKIERLKKPLILRDFELALGDLPEGFQITASFFEHLPELRRFTYPPRCEGIFDDLVLGVSCIPKLENLSCCLSQLALFVPNRPVSSVALAPKGPYKQTLLRPLMHSSSRIQCLKMSLQLFLSPGPRDYISNIDYLWLIQNRSPHVLEDNDNVLPEVIKAIPWSDSPPLRGVRIVSDHSTTMPTFKRINLKSQHAHLCEIPTHGPGPFVVHLGGIVWARGVRGAWSVQFDSGLREAVLAKADSEPGWEDHVRQSDYGNYLKSVLRLHFDEGSETEPESDF